MEDVSGGVRGRTVGSWRGTVRVGDGLTKTGAVEVV